MRMKNSLDKRTKWCYCIGATGRDAAYALVSIPKTVTILSV